MTFGQAVLACDQYLALGEWQSIRAEIVNNKHVAVAIAKRPLVGELG